MTKSSIKESNNILLNQTNSLDKKKMNEKKIKGKVSYYGCGAKFLSKEFFKT